MFKLKKEYLYLCLTKTGKTIVVVELENGSICDVITKAKSGEAMADEIMENYLEELTDGQFVNGVPCQNCEAKYYCRNREANKFQILPPETISEILERIQDSGYREIAIPTEFENNKPEMVPIS